MICIDNDENGVKNDNWDKNICKLETAKYILENDIDLKYVCEQKQIDHSNDMCYCIKCHRSRHDKDTYARGKPKARYELPIGWVRFGINLKIVQKLDNDTIKSIFKQWHVSYHGTRSKSIIPIFKSNCQLLIPGDTKSDGKKLEIRGKHIKKTFERINEYTRQNEVFDPNCIFTSPTIRYSALPQYCKPKYIADPNNNGKYFKIQYAFQCRQKPGSYKIGHETVGEKKRSRSKHTWTKHFENTAVEWYTKKKECIVLHGLLIKVQYATDKEINKLKNAKKVEEKSGKS